MSIFNCSLFFFPTIKNCGPTVPLLPQFLSPLCQNNDAGSHGSAPPLRRQPAGRRRPSMAQDSSRRCSPSMSHPHPVHDPIHGDVSSPPRTSTWDPVQEPKDHRDQLLPHGGHLLVRVPAQTLLDVHHPFQHVIGG